MDLLHVKAAITAATGDEYIFPLGVTAKKIPDAPDAASHIIMREIWRAAPMDGRAALNQTLSHIGANHGSHDSSQTDVWKDLELDELSKPVLRALRNSVGISDTGSSVPQSFDLTTVLSIGERCAIRIFYGSTSLSESIRSHVAEILFALSQHPSQPDISHLKVLAPFLRILLLALCKLPLYIHENTSSPRYTCRMKAEGNHALALSKAAFETWHIEKDSLPLQSADGHIVFCSLYNQITMIDISQVISVEAPCLVIFPFGCRLIDADAGSASVDVLQPKRTLATKEDNEEVEVNEEEEDVDEDGDSDPDYHPENFDDKTTPSRSKRRTSGRSTALREEDEEEEDVDDDRASDPDFHPENIDDKTTRNRSKRRSSGRSTASSKKQRESESPGDDPYDNDSVNANQHSSHKRISRNSSHEPISSSPTVALPQRSTQSSFSKENSSINAKLFEFLENHLPFVCIGGMDNREVSESLLCQDTVIMDKLGSVTLSNAAEYLVTSKGIDDRHRAFGLVAAGVLKESKKINEIFLQLPLIHQVYSRENSTQDTWMKFNKLAEGILNATSASSARTTVMDPYCIPDSAKDCYIEALKLDPENERARVGLAWKLLMPLIHERTKKRTMSDRFSSLLHGENFCFNDGKKLSILELLGSVKEASKKNTFVEARTLLGLCHSLLVDFDRIIHVPPEYEMATNEWVEAEKLTTNHSIDFPWPVLYFAWTLAMRMEREKIDHTGNSSTQMFQLKLKCELVLQTDNTLLWPFRFLLFILKMDQKSGCPIKLQKGDQTRHISIEELTEQEQLGWSRIMESVRELQAKYIIHSPTTHAPAEK